MKNSFKEAPGQSDGVILSRARRHGDAPFGQPFAYTDAMDLPGQFTKVPWYKRLLHRKRPLGWAEVESGPLPQAYVTHDHNREVRISPMETFVAVPFYQPETVIAAAEYEDAHPEEMDG